MSNLVVVQRPEWTDIACHWGQHWMNEYVVKPARAAGFDVIDLFGDDASRSKVLAACRRSDFIYFSGLGHGSYTTFTGQRREAIFWRGDLQTKAISKDKHFNFLSCQFGRDGAKWIQEVGGAIGVHGYDENFQFVIDQQNFPDSVAKPFFDAHTTVDRVLFKGKTHGEAHKACLERYEHWIQNAPLVCRRYLAWNKAHKVFWGNPRGKLVIIDIWIRSPIDAYDAVQYGKSPRRVNFVALIHCYYKRKRVVTCRFYKDGAELPDNTVRTLTFHYSHFDEVIDILRNESPNFYKFNKETKLGYLATGIEPVGEGEAP